jgi:pimeloyl-ACP methyl ester carboxylesterase
MQGKRNPRCAPVEIPVSKGVVLAGTLYAPARSAEPHRTVIMVHGFAAEKTENGLFSYLAEALTGNDCRVLIYSWRGLGKSGGDFMSSNLMSHVTDFESVVGWLAGQGELQLTDISAVGFSLGATVVALAIKRHPILKAAAFLGPALRPAVDMWPRYATDEVQDELAKNGFLVKNGVEVGRALLEDLRTTDLAPNYRYRSPLPLLVCHGSDDRRIPLETSLRIFAETRQRGVDFQRFDGASHSFRPEKLHWSRLARVVGAWLHRHG